jgi:hypothetical protein
VPLGTVSRLEGGSCRTSGGWEYFHVVWTGGEGGGAAYHDFCHKAHRKPYLYLHDRAAVQPAGGRSLMTGFRDVFPAPSVFFKSFALFSVVVDYTVLLLIKTSNFRLDLYTICSLIQSAQPGG